jgi:hypothetical protein
MMANPAARVAEQGANSPLKYIRGRCYGSTDFVYGFTDKSNNKSVFRFELSCRDSGN